MIKKFQCFFLLVFIASVISANDRPIVLSSASMFSDMAKNIGGELIEVQTIVPIGADPHLHEPTPKDVIKVSKADLILLNALTFEGWIGELIMNSGTKAVIDTITKGINPIRSEKYSNSADPHAWMEVGNGRKYAQNILNALIQVDPENKAQYSSNYQVYDKALIELDEFIKTEIQKIPEEHRILVTSHDAFAYYGKKYGLRLEAIQGISTEAEAQTSDLMRVTNIIRESNIPVIFIESTINPKLLKQIAKDNDIGIGGELYADSLGDEKSPASTYIDMMKNNTQVIVLGLTGNSHFTSEKMEETSGKSNLIVYGLIGILLIGGLLLLMKKLS
jgi:ABC-type Zn uptake system ZnuABC Zn-binding protein ZnuA